MVRAGARHSPARSVAWERGVVKRVCVPRSTAPTAPTSPVTSSTSALTARDPPRRASSAACGSSRVSAENSPCVATASVPVTAAPSSSAADTPATLQNTAGAGSACGRREVQREGLRARRHREHLLPGDAPRRVDPQSVGASGEHHAVIRRPQRAVDPQGGARRQTQQPELPLGRQISLCCNGFCAHRGDRGGVEAERSALPRGDQGAGFDHTSVGPAGDDLRLAGGHGEHRGAGAAHRAHGDGGAGGGALHVEGPDARDDALLSAQGAAAVGRVGGGEGEVAGVGLDRLGVAPQGLVGRREVEQHRRPRHALGQRDELGQRGLVLAALEEGYGALKARAVGAVFGGLRVRHADAQHERGATSDG
jgi:hypothetical protein